MGLTTALVTGGAAAATVAYPAYAANEARKDAKAEANRRKADEAKAKSDAEARIGAASAMRRGALKRNSMFTGDGALGSQTAGRSTIGV